MKSAELSRVGRIGEPEAAPGKRRGHREKVECRAMLRPAGTGEAPHFAVNVVDLSMYGVGFSSKQPLEIDEIYRFAMSDPRQAGSRVEIRSCRESTDGGFHVGAQFC